MEAWSLTQLVTAIEGGDQRAWSVLITRLTPAVNSAVRKFNVDAESRADAAAETWRLLFERLHTVENPERLPGWVSVVASNQLTSTLRRASYKREVAVGEDITEAAEPVVAIDGVVADETRQVLRSAVSKLSSREQTIVRCRAFTDEPVPFASIERRYGIPAGSVGPTLRRSLRKLRSDPDLSRFFSSRAA